MKKVILLSIFALMFVPMVFAQCEITSKNTADFLNEIPRLNSEIPGCNVEIPPPMGILFGNDVINVQIVRNDGSRDVFRVTTEDRMLTSIELGGSDNPSYVAAIAECAFDNVLQSENMMGSLAFLYDSGHLSIGGHGVLNTIILRVATLFARGAIQDMGQETEVMCPPKAVGEVCNHGGECTTGNCIYVSGQGAERTYRCSCDAFKYDPYTDSQGNCPGEITYPETSTGKPGDVCQHGGQCETGNCIYVAGEGAGRIYKCSCDPFKFETYSC